MLEFSELAIGSLSVNYHINPFNYGSLLGQEKVIRGPAFTEMRAPPDYYVKLGLLRSVILA